MNGAEIVEQIEDLLKEDSISPEAALRLILANQVTITKELHRVNSQMDTFKDGVEEKVDDLCKRVEALERYRTDYPSIGWLWKHRKKLVLFVMLLLMFSYAILFGWWIGIPEIRQAIATWFGIPVP